MPQFLGIAPKEAVVGGEYRVRTRLLLKMRVMGVIPAATLSKSIGLKANFRDKKNPALVSGVEGHVVGSGRHFFDRGW